VRRFIAIGTILIIALAVRAKEGGLESAPQATSATHHLAATPATVTIGYFDAKVNPVLRVKSGDTVELETLVSSGLKRLEDAGVPPDQIQPVLRDIDREVKKDPHWGAHLLTGPIFVEGAAPGDVLEVRLKSIEMAIPYAVNTIQPGAGTLPDEFPYARFKVTQLDLTRKVAKFSDGVEIPTRPFFGVLGVAPPAVTGRISSHPPWVHGGNMDNKELVAGTTLYLPVYAPGALFSVGDGHAGQGDGEVCTSALETSLKGTVQLVVRKHMKLDWPRAETPTAYITMGFSEDLEEAAKIALREMLDFLVSEKHLSRDYAYILASDAVDFKITQLVDGRKGVHAVLPKAIFVH
jgi:acetamidase/formamidase